MFGLVREALMIGTALPLIGAGPATAAVIGFNDLPPLRRKKKGQPLEGVR
jgi:hypothetical protein